MSKSTLKSILNVNGSQCKDVRTGVICLDFLVLFWHFLNAGSSVLYELQLSNGLLGKVGEETITIFHTAGIKGMNKSLQVLTGNKTCNSCNVFEMIVCRGGRKKINPSMHHISLSNGSGSILRISESLLSLFFNQMCDDAEFA